MLAAKKKGRHTRWGEVYHGAYAALGATAIMLAIWKWSEIAYLFYIAVFSYGLAIYGYLARKQKWKSWLQHHIRGMLGSYIGAVTAAACEYWRQYSAVKYASFSFLLVFAYDYWQSAYLHSRKTL